MVTANFSGSSKQKVKGLWQWDYGQILRIEGLDLPRVVRIDFSFQRTGGVATPIYGYTQGGVTEVEIPSFILEKKTSQNYVAYALIVVEDGTSGETVYEIQLPITARPKPESLDTPEHEETFSKVVDELTKTADRAEEAREQAESYRDQTEEEAGAIQNWVSGQKTEIIGIKDAAVAAKNTAIANANIATNRAEETEADKQATSADKAAVAEMKAATDTNVEQSKWYMQQQAAMLGKIPMLYVTLTLEELQAVPNAKEGDMGIVQEPNAMLMRYVTHSSSGEPITPAWVWMTDLNIAFNRQSILDILNLANVATSGEYADLQGIPNRYNTPLVLDGTGDTVEWDYSQSDMAVVTLTETKPLAITGGYNGAMATIHCYGALLDFSDTTKYNTSVTFDYIEPLEDEHITYTLIKNADKWDVAALPYKGAEYA